ncbi:hypothetical protein ACFX1S_026118 [Malus domestica]
MAAMAESPDSSSITLTSAALDSSFQIFALPQSPPPMFPSQNHHLILSLLLSLLELQTPHPHQNLPPPPPQPSPSHLPTDLERERGIAIKLQIAEYG